MLGSPGTMPVSLMDSPCLLNLLDVLPTLWTGFRGLHTEVQNGKAEMEGSSFPSIDLPISSW